MTHSVSGIEAILSSTEGTEKAEDRLVDLYRQMLVDDQSLFRFRAHQAWHARIHQIERARQHYINDSLTVVSCI